MSYIYNCFRLFLFTRFAYILAFCSKNGMFLCSTFHLITSFLNIFRFTLHLFVRLIKYIYRYGCTYRHIKNNKINNNELNELLIDKEEDHSYIEPKSDLFKLEELPENNIYLNESTNQYLNKLSQKYQSNIDPELCLNESTLEYLDNLSYKYQNDDNPV